MTAAAQSSTVVLIPSRTTPGREYPVRMVGGRAVGCPCKGRQYRPFQPCWHMRAADAPAEVVRLTHIAQRAISRRLRYAAPRVLRSVTFLEDGGFLIVTNSGGNAIAISQALGWAGYGVADGPEPCSVYVQPW